MGPGLDTHFIDFNSSEFVFVSKNLFGQEESRMENKSYFFGGNITFFFAIPFRGIGESISGWMFIAV